MKSKSPLIAYSHKYFQLTENCLIELINSKNRYSVTFDYIENETEEESNSRYKEKTKWSDFRVIEPILFNFYHGIELLLKGILILKGIEIEKMHDLDRLYRLTEQNLGNCKILLDILKKYCTQTEADNNLIADFFKINKITPSKFYIILKYPFDNNQSFKYYVLHNQEDKGIEFAKQIATDINLMKNEFKKI
jgi:HEPN domain-containing protein